MHKFLISESAALKYFIKQQFDISYLTLQELARKKLIKINGVKIKDVNAELNKGDSIEVYANLPLKERKEIIASAFLKEITVFENENFMIVNKPYNITTQGQENSMAQLTNGYIVHRLDKTTSGLLIIAKNAKYAAFFCKAFQDHSVNKKYIALCKGNFKHDQGQWTQAINGQEATTNYQIFERSGDKIMFSLMPITGRKHQLREHCAMNGCPIIGDEANGGAFGNRIYLHCYYLKFFDLHSNKAFEFKNMPIFLQI